MPKHEYLQRVSNYLSNVSTFREDAKKLSELIRKSTQREGQIWVIGNGGSASLSNHFATDLTLVRSMTIRSHSLAANSSQISALGNDFEFNKIFSIQLEKFARPNDLLVSISSSGNSRNILQAISAAKSIGMHTFSVLGFDGGEAQKISEYSFTVFSDLGDYGPTEDIHSMFLHATREELEFEIKN